MESLGTFDYVIIGGGTAGLTAAARLSEDSEISIAVLEAGDDQSEDQRVVIPGLANSLRGSELDWGFETVPQTFLNQRNINIAHGKLLGGSSGINNQAFIAPSAADIDSWAVLGNDKWSWEALSPYYKKCSTCTRPSDEVSLHLGVDHLLPGKTGDGPLQVSYPNGPLKDPLSKAWLDSFGNDGLRMSEDPFLGKSPGAYSVASTVNPTTKQRSFAANTYHSQAEKRPNYKLFTATEVQKIEFDTGDQKTARRVVVKREEQLQILDIRKEVIIAAGVFNSPKILELSGIGSPGVLSKHGITPIVHNENVGENLQDHLMLGVGFVAAAGVDTMDALLRGEPEAVKEAITKYQKDLVGPLASGSIASHAFVPLGRIVDCAPHDCIRLQESLSTMSRDNSTAKETKQVVKILESPMEGAMAFFPIPVQWPSGPARQGNFVSIGAIQSRVFSRGSVHIRSSKAAEMPLIDPRYLSSELDLELLALSLQYIMRIAKSPPISNLLKDQGTWPQDPLPNDFIATKEYVRNLATTTWHPCGTCAMLPLDCGGVVSQDLKVYGTRNVRVIDASIFPLIPRGNIQSTVYAVAERASEIILAEREKH